MAFNTEIVASNFTRVKVAIFPLYEILLLTNAMVETDFSDVLLMIEQRGILHVASLV